ncbi:MAG: HmuY family protein [Candidatus Eisenbacteria sp.]|nr:HmuY family protein [Candidatus Eisenbacteria bacterium]
MKWLKLQDWIFLLCAAVVVFVGGGCNDDSGNPLVPPISNAVGNEVMVDASDYYEWAYFSFSKGDTVTVEDAGSSLDWDLGLRRYHFRTNSGVSGSGEGAAINIGLMAFDSLTVAPDSGYVVDDSLTVPQMGGSITFPASAVLEDWCDMDMSTMPPICTPTNNIFVLKTSDGKYVKVWFKSYYNPEGPSGHITLQYLYQPNGSQDLAE